MLVRFLFAFILVRGLCRRAFTAFFAPRYGAFDGGREYGFHRGRGGFGPEGPAEGFGPRGYGGFGRY